jgi:hypothetical protein
MQANLDRFLNSLLPQVTGESASFGPLDGNPVLRNAHHAGNCFPRLDFLGNQAADGILPIERKLRAVRGADGVPRLFAKIGFSQESKSVRTQAFETTVIEFLGPHSGDKVAKIFNELPVLKRTDIFRNERLA